MKKIKILSSVILTTFLATTAVLAWVDLGTVNSSEPLTSILWNNLVGKVNENGNKISNTYTKAEVDALLSNLYTKSQVDTLINNSSSWPSGSYCIFQSGGSCPSGFTSSSGWVRAISGYSSHTSSYYSNTYIGNSFFGTHGGSSYPYGSLADVSINACCK